MQHFYSIDDVPYLDRLIEKALYHKHHPKTLFSQKNITLGLFFFNPSLRTRLSSQRAAYNLGFSVITLDLNENIWKIEREKGVKMNGEKAEHIQEAIPVMAQYCDILGVRSFGKLENEEEDLADNTLKNFMKWAGKPIINLESANFHPLQAFADCITIQENKPKRHPKVALTWTPHIKPLQRAVPISFMRWCKQMDVELVVTHPAEYSLPEKFTKGITIMHNQNKALKNADFVYAKSWAAHKPYGQLPRVEELEDWRITQEKMALTKEAKFMHCLPVRRNVVVDDEVLDSPNSLIIEQANNRTFAMQTVLESILYDL